MEYSRHVWADVSNMRPFCFLDISLVELSCFFFLIFVDGLFVTLLGWINFSSPLPHVIRVSTPAVTFWNHLPTEYATLIYDLDCFKSAVIKHLWSLFHQLFCVLNFSKIVRILNKILRYFNFELSLNLDGVVLKISYQLQIWLTKNINSMASGFLSITPFQFQT